MKIQASTGLQSISPVTRKIFLGLVVVSFAFSGLRVSASNKAQKALDKDGQQVFIGENIAVAQTTYGKVRGFVLRGIYQYRGIPYGANTAGKNRFMPPQKPKPWEGVRPAVFFGSSSPQDFYDRSAESYSAFVDHWNYDEMGEDCLRLNIWTPSINDGKKRPVLVWLHGGGFTRGNGYEQDGYDGENISRYGDIVFCSINHRLGSFGFTDLSSVGGEKFKDSGNVGMLDIIEALRWVHENIANFGGDPQNVTIMGQSGGGSKVTIVAAMPAAKGLVNKAVALSGSSIVANDKQYARDLGAYVLKEAGLEASQMDSLQNMPWNEYLRVSDRALRKFEKENQTIRKQRGGFAPVADGRNIPDTPFYVNSDPTSPDIPMILSSTFHEWNPDRDTPALENITLPEVVDKLRGTYGDQTEKIVNAYAGQFPESRPVEIWAMILSNRKGIIATANAKLHQKSPVYLAWFGWQSPLFDGRHRAFHCLDISFWFRNTDLMVTHTGGGKRPRTLSDKMSDALIHFMYTGNPNCKSLPLWPEYTEKEGPVMILNDACQVKNDPDGKARKLIP